MNARLHTVLLVDDEPEIVVSLRRALRDEPYRVIGTTSPREALDIVRLGGVDMIIADIDMPELDGIELTATIRAERPEVVRVLLTADVSLRSAMAAINRAEVYRYLTKPWQLDELRGMVREGLTRLDELRRLAAAEQAARAREAVLAALERDHPGIRAVKLADGVHVVDPERLRRAAAEAGSPELLELFARCSAPPESYDLTVRSNRSVHLPRDGQR